VIHYAVCIQIHIIMHSVWAATVDIPCASPRPVRRYAAELRDTGAFGFLVPFGQVTVRTILVPHGSTRPLILLCMSLALRHSALAAVACPTVCLAALSALAVHEQRCWLYMKGGMRLLRGCFFL
jgi:hypothetical protein